MYFIYYDNVYSPKHWIACQDPQYHTCGAKDSVGTTAHTFFVSNVITYVAAVFAWPETGPAFLRYAFGDSHSGNPSGLCHQNIKSAHSTL
jgi:hypothetical protein